MDFVGGHSEAAQREDVAQILDGGDVEEAFISTSIEMMLLEVLENFLDIVLVLFLRVRVDEYVV